MFAYIVRRTVYSFFIMAGVIILTFALFRLSSGDPAAAMLGKNPQPRELEDLRTAIGCDKPLFWGRWRRTEIFCSADFSEQKEMPGIKLSGTYKFENKHLKLEKDGKVSFPRNFKTDNAALASRIKFKGAITVNGKEFSNPSETELLLPIENADETIEIIASEENAEISEVHFLRAQEAPFDSQFLSAIKEIVSFRSAFPYVKFFDFGRTLVTKEPVSRVLWRGLWPSLCLMVPIFFGEMIIGIILALISTAFRNSFADRSIVLLSVAGMSVSFLVLIIAAQWYLGYYFNIFPVCGWGGITFLFLPVITGIVSGLGGSVRFYRTVFINELNKEYLRTAVAKGCSPFSVYSKHLLKNAMIPILTRASTTLPFLFTGSLLLESFFLIPGLGYAGVNALMNADIQMLKALVIISAFLFILINLATDIAYAWADPRIRLAK